MQILSRLLVDEVIPNKRDENVFLMQQLGSAPVSSHQIKDWTAKDPILARVKSYTLRSWPEKLLDADLKPYFDRMLELSVEDGCIVWGSRIVIPPPGRDKILEELHLAHRGTRRMKGLPGG